MRYMIIKKTEYERLKRTSSQTIDNYTYLLNNTDGKIKNMVDKIHDLSEDIKTTLEKLHLIEMARRTNAGKLGGLTKALNKEKEKNVTLLNTVGELRDNVKDLEVKLEESMSDKYVVKKIPSGRRPKTQTMKIKSCTVQSNIARKMFGDNK